MSDALILTRQAGAVRTLTLNRPQMLNAFTLQMADELIDAFGRASAPGFVAVAPVLTADQTTWEFYKPTDSAGAVGASVAHAASARRARARRHRSDSERVSPTPRETATASEYATATRSRAGSRYMSARYKNLTTHVVVQWS